jgi:cell division septation protein DedD
VLPLPPEPPPESIAAESGEFEIVMGCRQIAGVSLVVVVLLTVFSGVSYLIGKSAESDPGALGQAPAAQVPHIPSGQAIEPTAQPQSEPSQPGKMPAAAAEAPRASLFADPVPGGVYIQVGAVEKSVAQIWVEGLRTHGLNAFVAAGASDKIFLVLVGPLPGPDAYLHAKDALERIGLLTSGAADWAAIDSTFSNSAGISTLDAFAGPVRKNR